MPDPQRLDTLARLRNRKRVSLAQMARVYSVSPGAYRASRTAPNAPTDGG
jgi:hypothetical protein